MTTSAGAATALPKPSAAEAVRRRADRRPAVPGRAGVEPPVVQRDDHRQRHRRPHPGRPGQGHADACAHIADTNLSYSDGKADLLARRSGTGDLYLYKGTCQAAREIFATRISVGTGFQQYGIWD
ncbi:hypothetical protein AB0L75_34140 [Streptomyces sp. NPDC052101]|uniref:hypothetical protein n=1 Tax=Streptomyces sp. NPDC052101 TaxID=3155763 RepID=UPI00341F994E